MALALINSDEIEHRADVLRAHYGQIDLPTNVEKLANDLGIRVLRKDLDDDVSGFLVHKEGVTTIAVNVNHSPVRQRFTISHEIGHFNQHLVSGRDNVFVDKVTFFRNEASSEGEQTKEIEANKFAAALLMPKGLVKQAIELLDNDRELDQLIGDLAERFQVSKPAMGFRLVNLGYLTRYQPEY